MLREVALLVDEAGDADAAVELVRTHAPTLVILDLQMPGKSGLEILPILKARAEPPIILVLTNEATEHHRRECMAHGADFFFDKSTQFDRVLDVLQDPTGGRAALKG